MKSLYQFILESAGGFNKAPKDAIECRKYFDEHIKNGSNIPSSFIDFIYDTWTTRLGSDLKAIPFRCSDSAIKLARIYKNYLTDIVSFCEKNDIDIDTDSREGEFKVEKVTITFGDGSIAGGGRKAGGGLDFESVLCKNLQDLVLDDSANIEVYKEATLNFWNKIKDSATIKSIRKQVNDGANVADFIQVTGKGSTARNNVNQIIDAETFEVNMSKQTNLDKATEGLVTNVLTQSGKIIADVTISDRPNPSDRKWDINHIDPNDIYISCKDGDAQLTGISMKQPFYGDSPKNSKNTTLTNAYANGESYAEFMKHDDVCTKAFSSMCKMFDCDPEEVYNYFADPENKRKANVPLKIGHADIDNDIVSTLMQLQVGGNYWYVNSNGEVAYLDDDIETNKFKFISKGNAKLEPKMIRIYGAIKTKHGAINCDLVFRTSGNFSYPYRLFFVVYDKHIISKLYC